MKTKIGMGKESVSIYDRFADENNLGIFRNAMRRGVKRDSMYAFSKSISFDRKENTVKAVVFVCEALFCPK